MIKLIKENISKGNTEKALEKTRLVFKRHKISNNDVILLMNQFKSITKDYSIGKIGHSYLYKNMNRINSAILSLLDLNKAVLKKTLSY